MAADQDKSLVGRGEPVDELTLTVEIAYGLPSRQALLVVDVPVGATVADVISASGIEAEFPDLEVDPNRVGVFGQKVSLDRTVAAGDRVEIYRPLLIDPKEARRARAESNQRDG